MSMTFKALQEAIENIAPEELALDWDNNGVQLALHKGGDIIKRVLVALEITSAVIDEAKAENVDVIITHHPLIFNKLSLVDNNDIIGSYIVKLIKAGISVYSSHTAFDKAPGGNNIRLARLLELTGVRKMALPEDGSGDGYLCVIGELKEVLSLEEICGHVCRALSISSCDMRVVGDRYAHIKTLGLCTGAGAEFIPEAMKNGCQLFITGDVKYHEAMKAKALGIAVIDGGHYGTEKIFAENMAGELLDLLEGQLEVFVSRLDLNPFSKWIY